MIVEQSARTYVDFEPSFEWFRGEGSDILRIDLPGFKKEHLKLTVTSHHNLRTMGEHLLEGNQWSRFWMEFPLPLNACVGEIRAKFGNETFTITLPKDKASGTPSVHDQQLSPSEPDAEPPKPAAFPEETKKAPATEEPKHAQPIGDDNETKRKEENTVEELRTPKPPITEASCDGPVKEPPRAYLKLLLNVGVALVLVGLWFYLNFKPRMIGHDGNQDNIEEL